MERGAKPAKVEPRPSVSRKSRGIVGSAGRKVEQRLADALEQQVAISEILRVISQSPNDVQPVFETIAAAALKLCRAGSAVVTTFDGELLRLAAFANASPQGADAVRRRYPRPPGRSYAASRAILTRSVVVIPDLLEERDYDIEVPPLPRASAASWPFR